jgi:hypothetical protein
VLGILFAVAWATSAVADIPASRAFVGLFIQHALSAPHIPFAAGLASAILAGALTGGLVALCFNLFWASVGADRCLWRAL